MKMTVLASKMNLDIILTRWIVVDRGRLFRHQRNFPDIEFENILMAELTCKM